MKDEQRGEEVTTAAVVVGDRCRQQQQQQQQQQHRTTPENVSHQVSTTSLPMHVKQQGGMRVGGGGGVIRNQPSAMIRELREKDAKSAKYGFRWYQDSK